MDEPDMSMQKNPAGRSVYHEKAEYIDREKWTFVPDTKTVVEYLHSSWELHHEKSVVDGKQKFLIYAKHMGPIFARKFKIRVDIYDAEDHTYSKEIMTENPEETCVIQHEIPANAVFDFMECNVTFLPNHYISPEYILGNDFFNENRPHNVVLKLDEHTIYGNKVVFALWSNYLDNRFFSSKESEKITEFDENEVEDICGFDANKLFNMCLNRKTEFHRNEGYSNDIMEALEFVDRFNLQNLKNKCVQSFYHMKTKERKDFLAKNEEELKELSMRTSFQFLAQCLGYKASESVMDDCLPDPKTEKLDWKICETGVNTRQDVCLLVGEERFKVHKEYLAFWSPYFDRLFFGDFIEKEMTEMEIKEVEPQEFGTLLRLIYPPGDVKIDDSNVVFLLKLADRFEIKSVMAMCCSYLARKAKYLSWSDSPEQLVDILELADQYFLVDAQLASRNEIAYMNEENLNKYLEDNRDRLANLSENIRKFIVPSI